MIFFYTTITEYYDIIITDNNYILGKDKKMILCPNWSIIFLGPSLYQSRLSSDGDIIAVCLT